MLIAILASLIVILLTALALSVRNHRRFVTETNSSREEMDTVMYMAGFRAGMLEGKSLGAREESLRRIEANKPKS